VAAGDETTIDCEWYNALSDEQLEDYLTIFNLPWLDAQTLETQCAYVAAVKDLEDFLGVHPNSTITTTAFAPLLLRLAFHSAGTFDAATNTGGSNGGTLRFPEELADPENACIDAASVAVEAMQASRADYITVADAQVLAAYVALRAMDFPAMEHLNFSGGRFDSPWLQIYRNRLPSTEENSVLSVFVERMGMTPQEATALVGGAHNFGTAHVHCSGYHGSWTSQPTTWTVDELGSEFFRNLINDEWLFFSVCSYKNGTIDIQPAVSPFDPDAEEEEEEEGEPSDEELLAMLQSKIPYICEDQFINAEGQFMLVSDFHLRESEPFKEHANFYATDTTDQLAEDFAMVSPSSCPCLRRHGLYCLLTRITHFAKAFTKLVNFGLDRCGLFGMACAEDETCVFAASYDVVGDVYECVPTEGLFSQVRLGVGGCPHVRL